MKSKNDCPVVKPAVIEESVVSSKCKISKC
jgi:hypothetical protein